LTTKVKIVLTDPKKFEKRLNYEISGGKINGKGTSITWEMTGVKPGTYTITANVTSKKGKSIASATKTITVMECDDCGGDCFDCSHVVVEDPKTVSAGQLMIFNAIFRNGPFESTRLNWKVSDGVIVEGQGTPTIKVATSGLAGKSITATLEIEGECPDCLKTVTGSGSVKP
jgi:PKD repeat protein